MNEQTKSAEPTEQKPNEDVGFFFSSFLKIVDPDTKKVILQTRAD